MEEKKPKGLDRYLSKLESALSSAKRRILSIVYPSSQKGPEAENDLQRISQKIDQNPQPITGLGGTPLLTSTFAQIQKQQKEVENKPTFIKGAYALVRQENAISSYDLGVVNGFYKRIVVSGVAILFHSGITLHFLYQSRIITYARLPHLYPKLQYIWYPTTIALFVIFVVWKHSKLIRRMDKKYTPLWLEIKQIYKERDLERERARMKK